MVGLVWGKQTPATGAMWFPKASVSLTSKEHHMHFLYRSCGSLVIDAHEVYVLSRWPLLRESSRNIRAAPGLNSVFIKPMDLHETHHGSFLEA